MSHFLTVEKISVPSLKQTSREHDLLLIWRDWYLWVLKLYLVFPWSSLPIRKVENPHLQIAKNNQLQDVTLDKAMLNWPANFLEASLSLTCNFFISVCQWCLAGYNFSFSHLADAHSSRDYGDSGGEFLQRFFPFHSIMSGFKHKLSLWGGLPL